MENGIVSHAIDSVARVLEVAGVAVIGFAFLYAMIRSFVQIIKRKENPFRHLKTFIGRALQLGLEFLVAADIISTVTITPTMESIFSLGLLIAVRTFLSWSITVEIEGCMPWQLWAKKREA